MPFHTVDFIAVYVVVLHDSAGQGTDGNDVHQGHVVAQREESKHFPAHTPGPQDHPLALSPSSLPLASFETRYTTKFCSPDRNPRAHVIERSRPPPPPPFIRNSEKNGAPKAVLSDKLKQFFPLADASALSSESLTAAYSKGGKDGLLKHALEQAAAATEKKVGHIYVALYLDSINRFYGFFRSRKRCRDTI